MKTTDNFKQYVFCKSKGKQRLFPERLSHLHRPRTLITKLILFCLFGLLMAVSPLLESSALAIQTGRPPQVTFKTAAEGKAFEAVNWAYSIKPLWYQNKEGGTEFVWALKFQVSGNKPISNVQAKYADVDIRENIEGTGDQTSVYAGLRSTNDLFLITLNDNSHIQVAVELHFSEFVLIEENCEELNLKIIDDSRAAELGMPLFESSAKDTTNRENSNNDRSSKPPVKNSTSSKAMPFYLAYQCETIPSGIRLAVSVPREINWFANSFFESKGKGKNWKNFDLGLQLNNFNRQEFGAIEFEYESVHYPFQVFAEKTEVLRPISTFIFAAGMGNIGLQSPSQTQSFSRPTLGVYFELRPFSENLSLGGRALNSLPSNNAITYSAFQETLGFVGYTVLVRPNWYLEPRAYLYVLNGAAKIMNFFLVANNYGLGGLLRYDLSRRNQLALETMAAVSNSHLNFASHFSYTRKNRNRVGGWGISLTYESTQVRVNADKSGVQMLYLGPFIEY